MLCSTLAKRSRSRLQTDGLPGHCAGLQSPLAMLKGTDGFILGTLLQTDGSFRIISD